MSSTTIDIAPKGGLGSERRLSLRQTPSRTEREESARTSPNKHYDQGGEEHHHLHDTPFDNGPIGGGGKLKFPETPFTDTPSNHISTPFTPSLSTPGSLSNSSLSTAEKLSDTKELGRVSTDPKKGGTDETKRSGRKIPHSELTFTDFSLPSLTSFPEKHRKFEREYGAPWDRDFFDKSLRFALSSRWRAWPERDLTVNETFMTCSTDVLTRFFEYLKAHFHPQVASNSHHIDKVTRLCTLLDERRVQINPLNAVVELELLGTRIDFAQLMEVRLDTLNRK
jgi:hypothetical protein